MAKVRHENLTCKTRTSPNCKGSWMRPVTRGRVPSSCPDCKATAPVRTATKPVQRGAKVKAGFDPNRQCPCGITFTVEPGKGRKAEKCAACRASGVVYRTNDDGLLEAIQKDQLERESAERREQLGKERAENLFNLMQPLLAKKNRQVIVH